MISFLYFIVGAFILYYETNSVIKKKSISIDSVTGVAFSVFLFLIPSLIFSFSTNIDKIIRFCDYGDLLAFILSVVCYICYRFGYGNVEKPQKINNIRVCKSPLLYCVILAAISIVCFYYWANNYGGIQILLLEANGIRGGWIDADNKTAFFKHFVPTGQFVSLYIYIKYWLYKDIKYCNFLKKVFVLIMFLLTFFISVLYLIANDGRGPLGFYILIYIISYLIFQLNVEGKDAFKRLVKVVVYSGMILFLILNGDYILQSLRGQDVQLDEVDSTANSGIINSLCSNFEFIVSSHFFAILYTFEMSGEWIIIDDILSGLTAWLPTSLKPFDVINTWDFNTSVAQHYMGNFKGQTPHSLLSNSLYDLGILGTFIFPFIYGRLNNYITKYFKYRVNDPFYLALYTFLFIKVGLIVQGCSLYYIVLELFPVFISCIIYIFLSKKKLYNEKNTMSL